MTAPTMAYGNGHVMRLPVPRPRTALCGATVRSWSDIGYPPAMMLVRHDGAGPHITCAECVVLLREEVHPPEWPEVTQAAWRAECDRAYRAALEAAPGRADDDSGARDGSWQWDLEEGPRGLPRDYW